MKKTLRIICTVIAAGLILTGCGKKSDAEDTLNNGTGSASFGEPAEEKKDTAKTDTKSQVDSDLNLNGRDLADEVDLSSEDVILEFLEGEWTMINRDTREDFGTLRIDNGGAIDFIRTKDDASGCGRLGFTHTIADEDEAPDFFTLEIDDMRDLVPKGAYDDGDDSSCSTSGIFHIGIGEEKDYLYLKEIGNGDSMISFYAFNVNENVNDHEHWTPEWLFVRDKGGIESADTVADETFYAWAWERDSDGVWLQPMDVHKYETEEDYTGRKFMGGYFSEQDDIRSGYYTIADRADMSRLLEVNRWNSEYPLMMYEVQTDKKGRISSLIEVDQSFYNVYDMGELEPEFSFTDSTFTVNGYEMDMRQFAPTATAIMDCKRTGDWIIVDCHVNPHVGLYEFYNINSGNFEYEIAGANLMWHGDDLSSAVYSRYNEVYDFWGHLIGNVEEGEVYGLKWIDEETIGAECWIVDEIGREKEFTYEIEYRPTDKAVMSYYEYMLGGTRQLRRFMDELPEGAAALVMVNPPQKILDKLPSPQVYDEGAYDRVVVVSLMDDTNLHIESDETDESGHEKYWGRFHEANRGVATVFEITVPEGLPNGRLVVSTPVGEDLMWDIIQISGKEPVMSKFLTLN